MKDCKKIIDHISRLEGQLKSLRTKLECKESCEEMVPLALSALKSFDSLRSKMVENFVQNQLLEEPPSAEKWAQFQQLLKIIKA